MMCPIRLDTYSAHNIIYNNSVIQPTYIDDV